MRKQIFFAFLTAMIFQSCSVANMTKTVYGDTYEYKYELIKPITDTILFFKDSLTKWVFNITDKEIDFTLYNLSNQPLKIIWDESSIVQFGKAKKVMHKGVKYIDRNSAMAPTSIPPSSSIDDLVVPTDNIYYREGYYSTSVSAPGGWESKDLFIAHDMHKEDIKQDIYNMVGAEISVYLPVHNSQGSEIGYTFTFKITDIHCTTCKVSTTDNKKKI